MNIQKKKPKSYLRKLDVFGAPVRLAFEGKYVHKTRSGGFITIIIFVAVASIFINSMMTLFQRLELTIETDTDYTLTPPNITLDNTNFMFAIGIQDPSITFQNSIFSYYLEYNYKSNQDGQIKLIQQNLSLIPCSASNFSYYPLEFQKYNLQNTLCPQDESFNLFGGFYDDFFQYITINVEYCKNGTNPNVICASTEEMNNYIQTNEKIRISIFYVNNFVDGRNYKNPTTEFIDQMTWILSPGGNFIQYTDLFIRQITVMTDDNPFPLYSANNMTTFAYDNDRSDYNYIFKTTEKVLQINIRSGFYHITVIRTYEKITKIMASIGGVWHILHMVLGYLASYFNHFFYTINLANFLYGFDQVSKFSKDKKSIEIASKIPNNYLSSEEEDVNKSSIEMMNQSLKEKVTIKFEKINKVRSKLRFRMYEIIKAIFRIIICSEPSDKIILYKIANKKILKEIDLRNIVKRMHDIEKLKKLTMNINQQNLFNFVLPPSISIKNVDLKRIKRDSTITEILEEVKYDKISSYNHHYNDYCQVKRNDDKINNTLINLLDKEILDVFETIDAFKNEDEPQNSINYSDELNKPHNIMDCIKLQMSLKSDSMEEFDHNDNIMRFIKRLSIKSSPFIKK